MPKEDVSELLRKARAATDRKIDTLHKHPEVFSYAADKLGKYGTRNIEKMSRNAQLGELFMLKSFLESESSTLQGARRIALSQDISIFGTTKSGRAKRRMSIDERRAYWSLYDEFMSSDKYKSYQYSSTRIQQSIGEMLIEGGTVSHETAFMEKLKERLEQIRGQELEQERLANEQARRVYSGGWNPK